MFTALLDSCVLWPSTLRDFLLSLAFEGSYRFVFSEAILLEVEVNEELKLMDRGSPREESRSRARHLAQQMRLHFGDSIVTGWEGLEGTFSLPDEDDEHVLAAAVVGGAGCIVTENLPDFPPILVPQGIEIVTPAKFAYETVSLRPDLGLAAVKAMSARSGRNHAPLTPHEILDSLDSLYGLHDTTQIIRDHLD